jgi:hypothetical protein
MLLAAHGLRLFRTHYLTLVSIAVISTLTVIALRSDAFQRADRPTELPEFAKNPPPGTDIGLQYIQSVLWSPPSAELHLRSIVYYIYETEKQRNFLEVGLRNLANERFKLDEGGPEATNVLVRAATPLEDAAAQEAIMEAEELATAQGYDFEVVDLRKLWEN